MGGQGTRSWKGFVVLVALLFVARSLFVLSILPPFEGWDEYQHIAYVAFVSERGRTPRPGDYVPKSLYPSFVRYPQPALALRGHLDRMGALDYAAFWSAPTPPVVRGPSPAIALYQAQHPPLYYWLMSPILRHWSGPDGILTAITLMRLCGVLCGALSVLLIGLCLPSLIARPGVAHLGLLIIGVSPLLLSDCARVASDPLAVLFGTIAVVSLLGLPGERPGVRAALAGVAIGLGSLTKAFDLLLLPFAAMLLAGHAWRGRMSWGRAARAGLLTFGIAGLLVTPSVLRNLRDFGAITPMQELVANQAAGRTPLDYFAAAMDWEWLASMDRHYRTHSLHLSGWTFVRQPFALRISYAAALLLGVLGGILALRRRTRSGPALFRQPPTALHLLLLGLCFAAGVAFHAVSARLAIGRIFTNITYAMISLPWLYLLWLGGVAALPGRLTVLVLGLGMVSLMLIAEIRGLLVTMVPIFTGHDWGPAARERLAFMHPAWLGPELTLPLLGVALVLLGVALRRTIAALSEPAAP